MNARAGVLGRVATTWAVPALFAVGACWLFSDAVFQGEYLAASSQPSHQPPFAGHAPAAVPKPQRALNDLTYILEPFLLHAREAIRGGSLPLWDPHVGAGRPLGSAQAAPFSPLNWIAYVFPFWRSLAFILILKIIVASVGTYLFLRRLRLGAAAATFGGLGFAFGMPFVPLLGHGHTIAFAFFPWCLLLVDRLVSERRLTDALLLALVSGVTLYSGHPETILLVGIGAFAYAAFRLLQARRQRDLDRRLLALFGGASLLAACVGALALFPLAEVVRNSIELDRSGRGNLGHIGVGLFFPELWGRPDKLVLGPSPSNALSVDFGVRPYLGALAPAFAALGALGRRRPEQVFFAALGGLALLAVLDTPVQLAVKHLPLLSLMAPYHFIWLVSFSVAVLAAFGFDGVLQGNAARRSRAALVIAVTAALPVTAYLASHTSVLSSLGSGLAQVPTLRPETSSGDTAAAGAILRFSVLTAVALVAVRLLRRRASGSALAVILIALTLADLVSLGRGYFPFASSPLQHPPATPSLDFVQRRGPDARLIGSKGALTANLADEYGVLDARVQALPKLERYTRLFTGLGGRTLKEYGWTLVDEPLPQKLLDVFAVRYVLSGGATPESASLRTVTRERGERLLENRTAFPRARVAYGWRAALGRDAALRDVRARDADEIRREPAIEGLATSRRAVAAPTTATIRQASDTRIDVRSSGPAEGVLVLDDTYYPGWTATVDGRAAKIHAADVAFRAVRVGPGEHVVRFSYAPSWLGRGKVLTLAGIGAIVIGLVTIAARRRRLTAA